MPTGARFTKFVAVLVLATVPALGAVTLADGSAGDISGHAAAGSATVAQSKNTTGWD
ncbi:hypothetical protein [Streptomyces sp. NPDC003006]